MFSQWIVNGVGVGIEVFFGAFTFALCCCVVLAFAGVYLLCALIWWVYIRLSAVRGKKNGILHRKRAEGSDV